MPFCLDRKSTRLNSSHLVISYAVFCLKKKKRLLHRQQGGGRTAVGELRDCCLRVHGWRADTVSKPHVELASSDHSPICFFFFFNERPPTDIPPLPHPAVLPT